MSLETRGLTKKFGDFVAVNEITTKFETGQIHAVLGENGAGKSTFMKLLFGLHHPTAGQILVDDVVREWRSPLDAIDAGLGMVQQHFALVDRLSAIDNICLGAERVMAGGILDREAAKAHLEKMLPSASFAIPWERPVGELTVGQKQRVEILKLLYRNARVLVLDEPTAVLTPLEIQELFQMLRDLRAQGRTILLITHKLNEVLDLCDTFKVLRQGRIVDGGLVREASIPKIVASMIGRELAPFDVPREPVRTESLIELKDVTTVFSSKSNVHGGLHKIDLELKAGEIVGIAGVEGSGQTHLVEALLGLREAKGDLNVLGQDVGRLPKRKATAKLRDLGIGLVPEDRHHEGLGLDESCTTNLMIGLEDQFTKKSIFNFKKLREKTTAWAKEFDVRSSSLDNHVGSLSGGNQQKLIFAREVRGRQPKLLICHQPTRGVDLGAIDLIHREMMSLRNQGMGVLCISSELDELLKLSDRIYVLFDGRVTGVFEREQFNVDAIGAAMAGVQNA